MLIAKEHLKRWLIGLTASGLLLFPLTSPAEDDLCLPPPTTDAQCIQCHQAKVDSELTKLYVHQPFREGKCIICHLGGELTNPEKSAFKSEPHITWLAESRVASIEHWFRLPKDQVDGEIQLDIMLPNRGVYKGIIGAHDLTDLPEMPLDTTPPILTAVKVTEIEKGVFLSATISWQTDKLADTRIAYGTDKLKTTANIDEMTRSHQITIAPLQKETNYRYQVASADYLGNLAQAGIATFSTATTITPANLEFTPRRKVDPAWERQIYQDSQTGKIVLKVTTTTPSKVAVGIRKVTEPQDGPSQGNKRKKPCQHQMKTALETTINVCLPCHESYVKGGTRHPLQVGPKPGMVFPPELFLLANGKINCMTCHSAHSSNYQYRLVKSGKAELCRGCHTDK